MSYTVLARKFRSQTFDEVVGQEAITTTLRHAITQNRVHHGYLFCGTRGVGKTSMARILAKALNCLASDGPTLTPCGKCDSCVGISSGEDVDVVEIDAASNTGVDDVRVLRSNTVYRPARARFKIYIIDEVHMLSTQAFNALLKTLEEPPSHVKFIFATTEVHKVPATILSRVQRFDFRPIPAAEIAGQLLKICGEEGVKAEEAAIKRLARLANGSMRDALSLLDQMLSMSDKKITVQLVNELLPPPHDELFAALLDRIAASDAGGALQTADQSLAQGQTLDHWCELLISQIRDLMLLRVCGAETDLVDLPDDLRPRLIEQAKRFDSGALVYAITVLEELRRSVRSSGCGRALVEAAIVRLAEAAKFSSIESLLERVGEAEEAPPVVGTASVPRPSIEAAAPPDIKKNAPPVVASVEPAMNGVMAPPPRMVSVPAAAPRIAVTESAAPAPVLQRMSQADLRAAQAEPLVKAALDIFKGQVVHVQRGEQTRATIPPAHAAAEAAEPNHS